MTTAYPLSWPVGQKRTPSYRRNHKPGGDRWTLNRARVALRKSVEMLGGRDLVISSNVALRIDGEPRSGQRTPAAPGVAVYFVRKGKPLAFACDQHPKPEQNLRAIVQHLEAMRGMDRWGVGSLDQAFTGYQALPEDSSPEPWWSVLGFSEQPHAGSGFADVLRSAYRAAAQRAHPDKGGSDARMAQVNAAYAQAKQEAPHA